MTTTRCPTCKQPIRVGEPPTPVRECYDCGQPISRGERYTYQPRGDYPSAIVHRVCSNPTGYWRTAECKRVGVVGYRNLTKEEVDIATWREDELEAQFAAWRDSVGRAQPDINAKIRPPVERKR